MVLNKIGKNFSGILKKYRYAFIIILIGLILMAIPTQKVTHKTSMNTNTDFADKEELEDRLSKILSLVEGAGDVKVILTIAEGEEIIYQTNETHRSDDGNINTQVDTVITTAADRGEEGLTKQVNPQIYMGAVIVCNGADDPVIRLSIVDAVSKLTGLGANRISVLKMK